MPYVAVTKYYTHTHVHHLWSTGFVPKTLPTKSTLRSSLGVQGVHHAHTAPPNKHMGSANVARCTITAILVALEHHIEVTKLLEHTEAQGCPPSNPKIIYVILIQGNSSVPICQVPYSSSSQVHHTAGTTSK